MDAPAPLIPPSTGGPRSWLTLVIGLGVTAALVVGLVTLWPEADDGPKRQTTATEDTDGTDDAAGATTTTKARTGVGEPSERSTTTTIATPAAPADLFHDDLPLAYADLLAAAGNPTQIIELAVYDTYAFLAYRDPANPGNLDRRMWRDRQVDDAEPNPIDDRVNADTEPSLFGPGEIDPSLFSQLIADAPSHYPMPTEVTHVLVDRFLPFDQRVLIRVYAVPTDGRSGGGYVSYDTAGTFVKVCC
jgi:hypothetical protein